MSITKKEQAITNGPFFLLYLMILGLELINLWKLHEDLLFESNGLWYWYGSYVLSNT